MGYPADNPEALLSQGLLAHLQSTEAHTRDAISPIQHRSGDKQGDAKQLCCSLHGTGPSWVLAEREQQGNNFQCAITLLSPYSPVPHSLLPAVVRGGEQGAGSESGPCMTVPCPLGCSQAHTVA